MKQAIGGLIAALCFGLSWGCGSDDEGAKPADTCRDTCAEVVEAGCAMAPASVAECQSQCDAFAAKSACSATYSALQSCGKGKAIVCDPTLSIPVPEGCTKEERDFLTCYAQN